MVQFDVRQALFLEVFLTVVSDYKLEEFAVVVWIVDEDA